MTLDGPIPGLELPNFSNAIQAPSTYQWVKNNLKHEMSITPNTPKPEKAPENAVENANGNANGNVAENLGANSPEKSQNKDSSSESDKPQEYSPYPREIVNVIFDLWKKDDHFMSNPYAKILAKVKEAKKDDHWVLSEKRLKSVLKEFNLQHNQPKKTFLKETTSTLVPGRQYPAGTIVRMSKGRGKAMFATKPFKAGERMWEERPLLPPADVDMLTLKRKGMSCAYCGKAIRTTPDGKPLPRTGVPCINCTINWCSNNCKRDDIAHADAYHEVRTFKPKINTRPFKLYESYCLDNQLTAGYVLGSYFLHKIKQAPNSDFATIMKGMASVSQETKAASVIDPNTFEFEQYMEQLKGAYNLLATALQPVYKLTFEEYLTAMGTFNINNVENCMFEYYANLNHNCEPNIHFKFKSDSRNDGIVVYAKTDIEPGTELTTTYVDPSSRLDDRQVDLRRNWGFNCGCDRCKREKELQDNPPPSPKSAMKTPGTSSPTDGGRKTVHFEPEVVTSSC